MGALPPILAVDDDPDDLFIVKRLLTRAGVENKLVTFEDPAAALDHLELESRNPDIRYVPCVILSDLHMPGMDGIELTKRVRAHPRLGALPVVIITSSEDPADEANARAAGATQFLRKYPSSEGMRRLIASLPCQTIG